jgi:hypothetical protein
VWHAGVHAAEVAVSLLSVDFQIRAQIIWRKQHFVMSRGAYHWGHEPALLERLPALVPRLALVQLGDSRQPPTGEPNRCQLGQGILPLRQIVALLTEVGYDGFYEVELMGEEIESCDYRDLLAQSVRTFDDWTAQGRSLTP